MKHKNSEQAGYANMIILGIAFGFLLMIVAFVVQTGIWIQIIVGIGLLAIFALLFRLISIWWLRSGKLSKLKTQEIPLSYATKMQELGIELRTSFEKIDDLLEETQSLMENRRSSLNSLESNVEQLERREVELKKRVDTLEKIPLQALDYFIKATESAERKAARRDYSLFFWGLIGGTILSTIVSIILRVLGWL